MLDTTIRKQTQIKHILTIYVNYNISQSANTMYAYFKGICYFEWKTLYDVNIKINYNRKQTFDFSFNGRGITATEISAFTHVMFLQ